MFTSSILYTFLAKNAKKKKKKKAGQGEDLSDALSRTTLSEALLSSNHITSSEAASHDNEWKTFTTKGKSKRAVEAPPKAKGNAVGTSLQTSKPAQKAASKPAPAPAPVAQSSAKTDAASDPAKRLKNLRKKLREIETVEQKAASGVKLEKDQLDKIARKAEILQEIEDLE